MSSPEDAAAHSSSSPYQAAQPRDNEINPAGDLEPSGDELIEELSDTHKSDSSSTESFSPRSTLGDSDHNQQVPFEEAASPSIGKSPPVRPNNHHGSHATWRDQTAAERQIAISLEQLRAKDLSAHLYNFYSLKRKLPEVEQEQGTEPEHNGGFNPPGKAWVSSKSWVAWPMAPELVPRESDAQSRDAELYQEPPLGSKTASSHELLQELLAARACRLAKEKFHEREWENSSVESPATPDDPWLSRQAQILEEVNRRTQVEEDEPLVMADDETAKSILQPSLNHIGGKLDLILMGLHHARSSYATYGTSSIQAQVTTDGESSTDNKRKRKARRRTPNNERNQRRRSLRDVAEDLTAEDNEFDNVRHRGPGTDYDSTGPSRSRPRHERLGLRDWSDVLGVASMCGWDAGTVGRAVARCSALFGEGLVLRTLQEGQDGYHDVPYLPGELATEGLPEVASRTRRGHRLAAVPSDDQIRLKTGTELDNDEHDEYDQGGKVGGVHVDGFLQPIPKRKSWTRERKKGSKT
ncbi:MAG: hypothetical protein Q9208_005587 [Pyrenodesmia sp. 3 TL-2023]